MKFSKSPNSPQRVNNTPNKNHLDSQVCADFIFDNYMFFIYIISICMSKECNTL